MSRVFIIDDDPIHQRIAQIMIGKHEIFDQYDSFTDARSALEFLKKEARSDGALPDVILLDLNMPEFDGWDFLEEFGKILTGLIKVAKIFIVTSSIDEKDKMRSQTYPFVNGFISKPLSPDVIKSTI